MMQKTNVDTNLQKKLKGFIKSVLLKIERLGGAQLAVS